MSRTRRRFAAMTLAVTTAPALLLATGTPALAHYKVLYQGKDMASVSEDHLRGSVCDRERDGNWSGTAGTGAATT